MFSRDLDQWEAEHPTGSRGRIGSRIPQAGNIATVDAHNVLIGVSQRLGALATLGPPSREAYEQLLDQMVG